MEGVSLAALNATSWASCYNFLPGLHKWGFMSDLPGSHLVGKRAISLALAQSIIELLENSGTTFNEQFSALRVVEYVLPTLGSSRSEPSDSTLPASKLRPFPE